MDQATRLLTDLLRAEVCGTERSFSPLSMEETKALYLLAKRHEVAHLAGSAALRLSLLPENEKAKAVFEKESFTAVLRHERLRAELAAITAILGEHAIPHLPLKGSVLRDLYPAPWMRSSCDIDILIKESTLDAAKEVLLACGYTLSATTAHDISFDSPRGVHVELHFRLLEEGYSDVIQKTLDDVWSYAAPAEDAPYRYALSDDMFYYYHIAHMAKHYLHGGCGIRPFLDLWVLHHRTAFDAKKREALLQAGGLLPFATAAVALSEVWFGEESHTPITEKMEEFVLAGGVYGSQKNRIAVGQAREGGKFRYALSRIFLPYHTLKFHYPSLQKHKWLFPFFQVRRWCKLLFLGGARRSAKELKANSEIDVTVTRDIRQHIGDLGL